MLISNKLNNNKTKENFIWRLDIPILHINWPEGSLRAPH
jgi:hypothetical protein